MHGGDAAALADFLRHGRLLDFLLRINAQSLWPPLYPLLECPIFLIFGSSYAVARALMTVLFFGCALLIFWCGWELGGTRSPVIGAVALALFCTSPIVQQHATLVMLEIPGVLLLLLALGFFLRFQRTSSRFDHRVCCIATTALLFCKYNYGAMWLAPLAIEELLNWRESGRPVLDRLPAKWASPFSAFVALYLLFIGAIAWTGGWSWSLAGQTFQVHGIGNPIFFLLWILVLRTVWTIWRYPGSFRSRYSELPETARNLILFVGIPILVWFLVPPHLKDLVQFSENRSSEMPLLSSAGLLYYPRAFVLEYARGFVAGAIALALGLLPVIFRTGWKRGLRVLLLALCAGLLAAEFHPYKQPRFFFTIAPLLWLSAGWVVWQGSRWIAKRLPGGTGAAIEYAAVMGAVASVLILGIDGVAVRRALEEQAPSGANVAVLNAIAETAAHSDGTALLGTWNFLSPALVEWHCRLRSSGIENRRLPAPVDRAMGNPVSDVLRDRLAADAHFEKILVLDLPASAAAWKPGHDEETPGLSMFLVDLEKDRRFRLLKTRTFPGTGYRLLFYTRRVMEAPGDPPGTRRPSGTY